MVTQLERLSNATIDFANRLDISQMFKIKEIVLGIAYTGILLEMAGWVYHLHIQTGRQVHSKKQHQRNGQEKVGQVAKLLRHVWVFW